jgi:hypothetical protein
MSRGERVSCKTAPNLHGQRLRSKERDKRKGVSNLSLIFDW